MVGPFFFIDSVELDHKGWIFHMVSESKAEVYGDFLIDPIGHDALFRMKFRNMDEQVEYFDFPRGRVVYNTVTKRHIIYLDRCIRHRIDHIADRFMLKEYEVQEDDHYVCPGCMEEQN